MTIATDVKNAWRRLARRPANLALSTAVLAVGLGTMLMLLGLVNTLVLEPLPYPEPDRLLALGNVRDRDIGVGDLDGGDLLKLAPLLRGLEQVAVYDEATINIVRPGDAFAPKRYDGTRVGAGLFALLAVQPTLGRGFNADDDRPGAPLVVLLGDRVWRQDFAGDPGVVGRHIRVNGEPATVIGVMPRGFAFPFIGAVFTPRRLALDASDDADVQVVARLRAGTNLQQARAELEAAEQNLGKTLSSVRDGRHLTLKPLKLRFVNEGTRRYVWMMFTVGALVLLLACVNVGNLQIAASLARNRELAIRGALGASRARLLRELLYESLLQSALAGALALAVAHYGGLWLESVFIENDDAPAYFIRFGVDARMFGFAVLAALLTTVLAGLVPAMRASRVDLQDALRDGDKGGVGGFFTRFASALVVAEVALTVVLLIGAGTFVRGLERVLAFDFGTGADPRQILTARVGLAPSTFADDASRARFFENVVERLRADPNVLSASAATALPGTMAGDRRMIAASGEPRPAAGYPDALGAHVDDHFAQTYGIRLIAGRMFDARDQADSARVVVVDQRMAERLWPGRDPIGQTLITDPDGDAESFTVVGEVAPMHLEDADDRVMPTYLLPIRQHPPRFATLAVQARGDVAALAPVLAAAVSAEDGDTPIYWLQTQQKAIEKGRIGPVVLTELFSVIGVISLVLAAAGLYGVLAFAVAERTREIGIRRAIGAGHLPVIRLVGMRILVQVGFGLAIGLGLALPWSRVLADPLMQTRGYDPVVFAVTLVIVVATTLLASAVPLRRALRVEPLIALHQS